MATTSNGTPELTWTNIVSTIAVILTMFAGAWLLFQSQFANMKEQFSAADSFINKRVDVIGERQQTNVNRLEHTEFVKRLDSELAQIRDQLRIIETTRPTTGELQGVGLTTKEQLAEIKDRLRSLEDNLRRPQALAPVTPPLPIPGAR